MTTHRFVGRAMLRAERLEGSIPGLLRRIAAALCTGDATHDAHKESLHRRCVRFKGLANNAVLHHSSLTSSSCGSQSGSRVSFSRMHGQDSNRPSYSRPQCSHSFIACPMRRVASSSHIESMHVRLPCGFLSPLRLYSYAICTHAGTTPIVIE